MATTIPVLRGVGAGQVGWPFSFGVGQLENIQQIPLWSDITFGPSKLLQFNAVSELNTPQRAYLKIYNKANPQVGVDDPDIVVPVDLGIDPSAAQAVPFEVWEDGEPGMYFDHISMAVNGDPGTGVNPYTAVTSECDVTLQTVPV